MGFLDWLNGTDKPAPPMPIAGPRPGAQVYGPPLPPNYQRTAPKPAVPTPQPAPAPKPNPRNYRLEPEQSRYAPAPSSTGPQQRRVGGSYQKQRVIDSFPSFAEFRQSLVDEDEWPDDAETQQKLATLYHQKVTQRSTRYKSATPEVRAQMDAGIANFTKGGELEVPAPSDDITDERWTSEGPVSNTVMNIVNQSPIGQAYTAMTGKAPYRTREAQGTAEQTAETIGGIGTNLATFGAGAGLMGAAANALKLSPWLSSVLPGMAGTLATSVPQNAAAYRTGAMEGDQALTNVGVDALSGGLLGPLSRLIPGNTASQAIARNAAQTATQTAADLSKGVTPNLQDTLINIGSGAVLDVMGGKRQAPPPIEGELPPPQREVLALPPATNVRPQGAPRFNGVPADAEMERQAARIRSGMMLPEPQQMLPAPRERGNPNTAAAPEVFYQEGHGSPSRQIPQGDTIFTGSASRPEPKPDPAITERITALEQQAERYRMALARGGKMKADRRAKIADSLAQTERQIYDLQQEYLRDNPVPRSSDNLAVRSEIERQVAEQKALRDDGYEKISEANDAGLETNGGLINERTKLQRIRMMGNDQLREQLNKLSDTDTKETFAEGVAAVTGARDEIARLRDPLTAERLASEYTDMDRAMVEQRKAEAAARVRSGITPDSATVNHADDEDIPAFDDPRFLHLSEKMDSTPDKAHADVPMTKREARQALTDLYNAEGQTSHQNHYPGKLVKPLSTTNPEMYKKAERARESLGQQIWQRRQADAARLKNVPPTRHRQYVEEALAAGKQVPVEVLADYPDLSSNPKGNPWEFSDTGWLAKTGVHEPWIGEISPMQMGMMGKQQKAAYEKKRHSEWETSASAKAAWRRDVIAAYDRGDVAIDTPTLHPEAKRVILLEKSARTKATQEAETKQAKAQAESDFQKGVKDLPPGSIVDHAIYGPVKILKHNPKSVVVEGSAGQPLKTEYRHLRAPKRTNESTMLHAGMGPFASTADALRAAEQTAKAVGYVSRKFDQAAARIINAVGRRLGATTDLVDATGTLVAGRDMMDAAAAYLRSKKQNALADKISAAVVDDYALPENYRQARDQYRQTQDTIARQFMKAHEEQLSGLSAAEQAVVYDILTNENASPGAYQTLRSDLRNLVDTMGQRAVDAGVISQESFDRNKGTYLSRSYAEHEMGNKAGNAAGRLGRAIKFATNQMKGRGVERSVADSTLARLQPIGTNPKTGKPLYQINGETWELRAPNVLWRDWNKAERVQMGELENASYAFLKTGHQVSRNIATGEFYQSLSRDSSIARKPATEAEAQALARDGWVLVGGNAQGTNRPKWGALDGHYVQPDVHRDLTEIQKMQASGVWKEMLTQWKLNKTARNPVVHVNNIMSNFSLLELNGGNADDVFTAGRIMSGHGDAAQAAMYEQAKELGVMGSVHEDLGKDLSDMLRKIGPVKAGMTLPEKVWHFIKSADQKMLNLYGAEDGLFRFALYMNDVKSGISPEQAAKRAKAAFVDYNITAPAVNAARNSVLPFVGYAYRALPLMLRGVAERPWKAAKIALAWQGANALFSAIAGGNEKEERAAMAGQVRNAPFHMRLPVQDSRGQSRYLDTTKYIPGADILGGINEAARTGDAGEAIKGVGNTFSMGGPLLDAYNLMKNQKPDAPPGLDHIWNENTPKSRQWKDAAKFAYESLMPNNPLIPGTYSFNKIAAAVAGRPDQYGRQDTVPTAAMATVGVKTRGVDVDEMMDKRMARIDREIRDAEAVMKQARTRLRKGIIGKEDYQQIRDEQRAMVKAARQRKKDYKASVKAAR